jgi:TRAP-type C4-dicarboxylate transport system substrate-binding protein
MNQDVWDGLTPDAQAAIDKEAGRVVSLQAATVYDGAYASVSAIAVEEGVEKLILPEDELARWHALGDVVIAAWIAERDAEGLPGQAMFDRMQELIEAG